ncbi:MAG TPA: response regulator transcription factor [Polyangiaceae bacterium]|nr:response regulator transcription factor [Polyangiaceae bacterium]
MRGICFPFKSFETLSEQLEANSDEHELDLSQQSCSGGLKEREWVLATFTIGEESTCVAGRVIEAVEGMRISFEERDWDRIWSFAHGDAPPSLPPATLSVPPVPVQAPPDSRVLVVDDDSHVQTVVSAMLSASGFEVSSVGTAEEAFDHLRQRRVDLLVLDWNLPGMSGLDLCKRLRCEESELGKLPILFLTAHSSSQDVSQAFAAGADDFVSKPFRAPELGARVLGLLHRAAAPAVATSDKSPENT